MASDTDSIQLVAYAEGVITQNAATLWTGASNFPMFLQGSPPGPISFAQSVVGFADFRMQVQNSGISQPGNPAMLTSVSAGRVDLICSPSAGAQTTGSPRIFDRKKVLQDAIPMISKVAKDVKASRIAIVVQLSERTNTVDEAVNVIKSRVTNLTSPKNCSELFFQTASLRQSVVDAAISIIRYVRYFNASQMQLSAQVGQGGVGLSLQQTQIIPVAAEYIDVSTEVRTLALLDSNIDGLLKEIGNEIEILVREGYKYLV